MTNPNVASVFVTKMEAFEFQVWSLLILRSASYKDN